MMITHVYDWKSFFFKHNIGCLIQCSYATRGAPHTHTNIPLPSHSSWFHELLLFWECYNIFLEKQWLHLFSLLQSIPCCSCCPRLCKGKNTQWWWWGGDEEQRERERETPRQPRFVEASKEGKQTPRQSLETTKCLELSLFLGMAQDHVLHMSRFTKTSLTICYGVFGWWQKNSLWTECCLLKSKKKVSCILQLFLIQRLEWNPWKNLLKKSPIYPEFLQCFDFVEHTGALISSCFIHRLPKKLLWISTESGCRSEADMLCRTGFKSHLCGFNNTRPLTTQTHEGRFPLWPQWERKEGRSQNKLYKY